MDQKTIDARLQGEAVRVLENISAQESIPRQLWWLSYAGDEGFRGAVIVAGSEFTEAVMRVNLLGINPGGEIQGMPVPEQAIDLIPDKWKNRLLSRAECEEFDKEMERGPQAAI